MTEYDSKLRSLYSNSDISITPTETQVFLERMKRISAVTNEIGYVVPQEIIENFLNDGGVTNSKRFDRFKISVELFANQFGEESLMDLDCDHIRKNGSINWRKFKRSRK